MAQWIGLVTESPQGFSRIQSFEIARAASNEFANKTFDPFSASQSGGDKLGISDPCYKSWDVDT